MSYKIESMLDIPTFFCRFWCYGLGFYRNEIDLFNFIYFYLYKIERVMGGLNVLHKQHNQLTQHEILSCFSEDE